MVERTPRWTAGGTGTDLAAPDFYAGAGHLEVWREARRVHPIAWAESGRAGGFWSVTTHALAGEVLKQARVFCSGQGMRLVSSPAAVRAASGKMLVVSDGQTHRGLRAAHAAWFSSRGVAALRPALDRPLDALLRGLLARETTFDAVAELAIRVPMWALFEMMDVPSADQAELTRLTTAAFDDSDETTAAARARAGAHAAIFAYFAELVRLRRTRPGTDIVTSLTRAEVNGRRLSDEEVILNCDGLLNGGLETTPHALSGAMLAFARHPDAWQRLREDPLLIDGAVEEILRWTSPAMQATRTATADASIGSAAIGRGERVTAWLPSANRDETVFGDADVFRIDRDRNPHLAFGAGPHLCIGAGLARLELRSFLAAMTRLVGSIEVDGTPVRQPSNFLNGLTRLDVRLTPGGGVRGPALRVGTA